MEEQDGGARLTVGAVAARLGLAPATLRTWDRRYGLGPRQHPSGSHRRYDESDVSRLVTMRRLVQEGVAPAEAARLAREAPDPAGPVQFPDRDGHLPARSGGRVLSLPGAADVVRGLGRAAMALDAEAVRTTVADQLERHGVVSTWEGVILPLLVSVGDRWAATGEGVEVEHLVSDCVAAALRSHATAPEPPRPVLLAGAPDDLHTLPQYAVAAALAERGIGSRVLGASVPTDALGAAIRRTSPTAVLVWSQTRATGHAPALADLPRTRPAAALVAGGPGWPEALPSHVTRAGSLGAALDLVGQALTGQALASEA